MQHTSGIYDSGNCVIDEIASAIITFSMASPNNYNAFACYSSSKKDAICGVQALLRFYVSER